MSLVQFLRQDTNTDYSPWDQLPAPTPMETTYLTRHFYENTAKHLVRDTVRVMMNGLHIDLDKVSDLEATLDSQLEQVNYDLANNPIIQSFNEHRHRHLIQAYIDDRHTKLREPSYYLKPFNPKDTIHRSYFMTLYANEQGIPHPEEEALPGIPKWSVKLVRKLGSTRPILNRLLDGKLTDSHPLIAQTIQDIAEYKASLYNKSYLDQIENPSVPLPEFNPGSSKQKQELFAFLDIEPLAYSKDTGLPSWGRDQIEEINHTTTDPNLRSLTQSLIDYSYAAIVRTNFIEAFYNYTVDNRLYGNYRLLGAKTGRYTSNSPNMLNVPSTGSIFAKPIKRCFTAQPGFVVASIDYSALEDRVVANLSKDPNKLGLFLEGLDGHSLSATYYYPERVTEIIGLYTDNKEASSLLKSIVDDPQHPNHKPAKEVRQDSKPISFGLAYGAYPKKVASTVKIPIEEAETIFNAYHNELYPGITEFRENRVLPTATEYGQIHLGLGFHLQTDDPDRDIRTLNNACSQFWSILTGLTINKLHHLIDEAGYQNDILVTSTIYDSIYFEVRNDPTIIKWLNDHIIPIMEQDFLEDQIVHNSANLEIGPSWADLHELPHEATLEYISDILTTIEDSNAD